VQFDSICIDSREVREQALFCAVPGEHTDGHAYITDALARGATVVVIEHPIDHYDEHITYLMSTDIRATLSRISAWFYRTLENPVSVIGVTGTDGKSSTCYMLYQLLQAAGIRASLLSTVSYDDLGGLRDNHTRMTTPEAPLVHRFLHDSWQNGAQVAILEASSHALSLRTGRLRDVSFTAAVCTTITVDHLDFHKTSSGYVADKMQLFAQLAGDRSFGILASDCSAVEQIRAHTDKPLSTYSISDAQADLCAVYTPQGSLIGCEYAGSFHELLLPFAQPFFIHDLCAALLTALRFTGSDVSVFTEAIEHIRLPTGRCTVFPVGTTSFIVDYAHTEDAFFKLLSYYASTYPLKRMITLFGAAGGRDHGKRSRMGKIAAAFSRLIIITAEDPRDERPARIFEDICMTMTAAERERTVWIEDRSAAIAYASRQAEQEELIFFLGKGHEKSMISDGNAHPWDELETVGKAVEAYRIRSQQGVMS
jgi:UDP-N-acetylmuramoyl-L-alanyl-D-glutamate--2,6-diaminopimelate ligase